MESKRWSETRYLSQIKVILYRTNDKNCSKVSFDSVRWHWSVCADSPDTVQINSDTAIVECASVWRSWSIMNFSGNDAYTMRHPHYTQIGNGKFSDALNWLNWRTRAIDMPLNIARCSNKNKFISFDVYLSFEFQRRCWMFRLRFSHFYVSLCVFLLGLSLHHAYYILSA